MAGCVCYVSESGPDYDLTRVPNIYVRDALTIPDLIASGRLSAGEAVTWAIEEGDHDSAQTPVNQQTDLEYWLSWARRKCHEAGAILIAAPAGNITTNLEPDSADRSLDILLRQRIPALCSRYADIYEIQAQQMEQNIPAYTKFVGDCAAQARTEIKRRKPILAGLTTNSPKSRPDDYPTAQEIAWAAQAIRGVVDGYWLNVPPHRITGAHDYQTAREAMRIYYGLAAPAA